MKNESDPAGKNSNVAPTTKNNSSTRNDNLNAEQSDIKQNDKVSDGNNAVTFNSFGKVKTGMTVSQASQALGTELVGKAEDGIDCYYVNPKQGFKGVRFMVTNGSVARIEIESKAYATDQGAKIGDTEAKIKSLYKGVQVYPQNTMRNYTIWKFIRMTKNFSLFLKPTESALPAFAQVKLKKSAMSKAARN